MMMMIILNLILITMDTNLTYLNMTIILITLITMNVAIEVV